MENTAESVLEAVRKALHTPENASVVEHAEAIYEDAWKYRDMCDS